MKRVSSFENDLKEILDDKVLQEAFKEFSGESYYYVTYSVIASSSRYVSLLVTSETYAVGAAHPAHTEDTFIFDINNKKLVSPSSLFTSPTYIEKLSSLTRADFAARNNASKNASTFDDDIPTVDVSLTNDGFLPIAENFSKILPTKDGLVVYFSEYQIAPYVYGPQESLIAYDKLKTIINRDGVLSEYGK